ncbi:hypothetical protein HDU87_003364 [Geranomyces variabilis]|uniref:GmrSD restriction endonucleases C-terminal domain-containing protein n=1 Tax=Geranomyces variabilis TaxID=109894 RepID=A0AAD5TL03_9FUNG|nr:hypothetical protein HDU87_003364 [Geranomyces variabilis]
MDSNPSSCDVFLRDGTPPYEEFYLDLPRFGSVDFVMVAPGLPEAYSIFCTINKTGLKFGPIDYLKAIFWGKLLVDGNQGEFHLAFHRWLETTSLLGEEAAHLLEHVYRVNRIKECAPIANANNVNPTPEEKAGIKRSQAEIAQSFTTTLDSPQSPQHMFFYVKQEATRTALTQDREIIAAISMLGTLPQGAPYNFWVTILIAIERADAGCLSVAAVWKAVERVCALILISAPSRPEKMGKWISRILHTVIHKISHAQDSMDAPGAVVESLNLVSEERTRACFKRITKNASTTVPAIALKYILRRLNLADGGQNEWHDLVYGNIQTEHIAPLNGQRWERITYEALKPFLHYLGNLTLLHGRDNSVAVGNEISSPGESAPIFFHDRDTQIAYDANLAVLIHDREAQQTVDEEELADEEEELADEEEELASTVQADAETASTPSDSGDPDAAALPDIDQMYLADLHKDAAENPLLVLPSNVTQTCGNCRSNRGT